MRIFLPKNFRHFSICYTIIVPRDRELFSPLVLFVTIGSSLKKNNNLGNPCQLLSLPLFFEGRPVWAAFLLKEKETP